MTFRRNMTILTIALAGLLPAAVALARGGNSSTLNSSSATREPANGVAATAEEDDGALFDPAAAADLKLPNGQRWTPDEVGNPDFAGPSVDAAGSAAGTLEMPNRSTRMTIREATLRRQAGRHAASHCVSLFDVARRGCGQERPAI